VRGVIDGDLNARRNVRAASSTLTRPKFESLRVAVRARCSLGLLVKFCSFRQNLSWRAIRGYVGEGCKNAFSVAKNVLTELSRVEVSMQCPW